MRFKTHSILRWSATLLGAITVLGAGTAQAAPSNPLTRGLVAAYCFDTSLTQDCSGNLNEGAVTGDVSSVPGVYGNAAQFGGYTSIGFIQIPNSPSLSLSGDFTFAYWAKLNSFAGIGAYQEYLPYGIQIPLAKSFDRYGMFTEFNGQPPQDGMSEPGFNTGMWVVNAGSVTTSAPTYALGQWVHVAYTLTKADGALKLYLNGLLASTATLPTFDSTTLSAEPLFLGAQAPYFGYNVYQYPFAGALDEVRVYNRALGALEVRALPKARLSQRP